MTEPANVKEGKVPLLADKVLYTDGVAEASIGPLVSKITFGTDVALGQARRPEFTVVMPSAALLQLTQQLVSILQADIAQNGLTKELDQYVEVLRSFRPPKA